MSGSALTFGVLGALQVCRDGEPVGLPRGRRRAVLAALLVRAGRPVPADALIDAAWPAEPPALASLADASLVAAHHDGSHARFRLLMIVRAFAAEQLSAAWQQPMARLAHARWVASVVQRAAQQATGPGCAAAMAELIRIQPDAAGAVRRSLDCGQPGLAALITGNLRCARTGALMPTCST